MIHAKQHRESKRPQSVEPIETGNHKEKAPRPAKRRKIGEARGRPSHMRPVSLNKGKRLSASKRSKFENWYSNSVSSIFDAEDL